MKPSIDFRVTDQHQHQHATRPEDGALDFTPEQTPDEARAWLARLRHDRDQERLKSGKGGDHA